MLWLYKNILTSRKYILKYLRVDKKYLGVKSHDVCNLLSNNLGKKYYFLIIVICIKWLLLKFYCQNYFQMESF